MFEMADDLQTFGRQNITSDRNANEMLPGIHKSIERKKTTSLLNDKKSPSPIQKERYSKPDEKKPKHDYLRKHDGDKQYPDPIHKERYSKPDDSKPLQDYLRKHDGDKEYPEPFERHSCKKTDLKKSF